jgi:hypothetical protein
MDTREMETITIHGYEDGSVSVTKNFHNPRHKPEEVNFEKEEGNDLLTYVAQCLDMDEQGRMFHDGPAYQEGRESSVTVTVSAGEGSEEE